MLIKIVAIIVGVIGLVFLGSLLFAFPVMWLWNYLMPNLFGLKEIGLWQSFCLLMLAGLLFKGGSSSSSKD